MSLLTLDHDVLSHGINQEGLSARLEDFAFRYGRSAESYLVTEPGRESFWLPDYSGVIVYLRRGRYLHVGGGLLAADADKPLLLEAFTRWTTKSRLRPCSTTSRPTKSPSSGDSASRSRNGAKRR